MFFRDDIDISRDSFALVPRSLGSGEPAQSRRQPKSTPDRIRTMQGTRLQTPRCPRRGAFSVATVEAAASHQRRGTTMNEPTAASNGPAGQGPPDQQQWPQPYGQPPQPYGQPPQPYGQPPQLYGEPPPWGTPTAYRPEAAVQPYGRQAIPSPGMGLRLVSPGGRLGAFLLDALLCTVTLGIGWLIWTLITWSSGQTPAKQLLHQVVADAQTGRPFTWGRMFLREFVLRGIVLWLLNVVTLGVVSLIDALMVFREDRRTLHDLMAGSVVIYQ
jgi:uncharacterized RDD family membrane protein YckC